MVAPVFFVTGTDTDVGKTFVSSLLTVKWKAQYWKPIQTGIDDDSGDTVTVKRMCASLGYHSEFASPRYEMKKPLSPLETMKFEPQIDIQLSSIKIPQIYPLDRPLIIEGAGGVCVPITKELETTVDLMKSLIKRSTRMFRVVIVARSGLGTLNHTILTVEYLKAAGLQNFLLGCILSGKKNSGNLEILKKFGIKILAQVDHCETIEDIDRALEGIPSLASLSLGDSPYEVSSE